MSLVPLSRAFTPRPQCFLSKLLILCSKDIRGLFQSYKDLCFSHLDLLQGTFFSIKVTGV